MQRWFILHFDRTGAAQRRGPMSTEALVAELRVGRLMWSDLAFCAGVTPEWARIFDIRLFRDQAPAMPSPEVLDNCRSDAASHETWADGSAPNRTAPAPGKTAAPQPVVEPAGLTQPSPRSHAWYAQIGGREQGPMEQKDLQALLRLSSAKIPVAVWREGLRNWRYIRTVEDLDEIVTSAHLTSEIDGLEIETGRNVRTNVRQSLVSTAYRRLKDSRVFLGTCADISERGVQIEYVPEATLNLNDSIMLDIFPLSLTQVPAFAVVGTVVWVSEGRRRAGVRFTSIHESAQRAIAVYIQNRRGEKSFANKLFT